MPLPSVLLAADSLAPGNGGICRVARMMARVLALEQEAGHLRVDAITLADEVGDPGLGLAIRSCGGSRLRFVLRVQRAVLQHSHVCYDMAGMARAHSVLQALGKPFACWIYGIEIWEHARPDRVTWSRRADLLLAISSFTKAKASQLHTGLDHAQVCWLATEEDDAPSPSLVARESNVMIVGRMDTSQQETYHRFKGHAELIGCWPEVLRHIPSARLLIVGGGPGRPAIEALAKASPAAGAIDFLGFVPDASIGDVFARSSVFAMPSRGEGFGLVYIEAMRHGLPVIAAAYDASSEVNLDGVTGFNVNLEQPAELPQRIVQLLQDPELARRMGEAGRQRWAEHFRFSAFRSRFLALLNPWLAGG